MQRLVTMRRSTTGVGLIGLLLLAACSRDPSPAPGAFEVRLVSLQKSQESVRPGEQLWYSLELEGAGEVACGQDLQVFVHLEDPRRACKDILAQDDHAPRSSTLGWRPGELRKEPYRSLSIPPDASDGARRLHVGLYERSGDQVRILDASAGEVLVSSSAPELEPWTPAELGADERAARRARRAAEFSVDGRLEGSNWTLEVDARAAAWRLRDARSGAVWGSDPRGAPLARASSAPGPARRSALALGPGRIEQREAALELTTALTFDDGSSAGEFVARFEPSADGRALRLSAQARAADGWSIARIEPLLSALPVVDALDGRLVIPRWEGELELARGSSPRQRSYREHDLSMSFVGAIEAGSALYATWDDGTFVLETRAGFEDHPRIDGRTVLDLSLELAGPTAWIELWPLGPGDELNIAHAHRATAQERGYRVTRAHKRATDPDLERLAGAAILRARALECSAEGPRLRQDFAAIAALAEHLQRVCGVDRALLLVSGWNRAGHGCELPDTMPACEPCGGDAGLAACVRRVRELGYRIALQDDYQDIHESAPSFDPELLSLDEEGEARRGENEAGAEAWRLCTRMQLGAAGRNLPQMLQRYAPNLGWLDTTLTSPLQTCAHAQHPLELVEDRAARQEILALARGTFGALGAAGAREWALPYADLLEAPLTQSTADGRSSAGAPLFLAVYGDCASLSMPQTGLLRADSAATFLEHLLLAQMPALALGEAPVVDPPRASLRPTLAGLHVDEHERLQLGIDWQVLGPLARDLELFVHFLDVEARAFEEVAFQGRFMPARPTSSWAEGSVVRTVTPRIQIPARPDGLGRWEVRVGVSLDGTALRLPELGRDEPGLIVGELRGEGARFELDERDWPQPERLLAREGGWGAALDPTDRAIANAYRVLSPLARLVQDEALSECELLTPDGLVQRTRFGEVEVIVQRGSEPFEHQGAILPRFGFLVRSPSFIAFHATRFGGIDYPGGALFTMQSRDGLPLAESRRIHVYRGFGPSALRLPDRVVEVEGEAVFELGD